MQRQLTEHRRTEGFAPQLRIGLHSTEARDKDGTYRGKGVHEAVRIAAHAEAGEILAGRSTLAELEHDVPWTPVGPTVLQGISEPVEFAAIRWA